MDVPLPLHLQAPAPLDEAVRAAVRRLAERGFARRLWERDASLWKDDASHTSVIGRSLGWLTVPPLLRDGLPRLRGFADEVRSSGITAVVLLGMGGSSLAPEVLQAVHGTVDGWPSLRVLDSTDPEAVLAVERELDLDHTLFVVASKSGGTVETASFHAYFHRRLSERYGERAGTHFVAVTDKGTALEAQALDQGFQAVFLNPSDIGGRYSALSYFGLVPAALCGVPVAPLLESAMGAVAVCGAQVPEEASPGVWLGAALGAMAQEGRDKLTLVAPGSVAPLGAWIEQLVAESTGKEGRGVLPVDLEPLAGAAVYGDDRFFVYLRPADEDVHEGSPDRAVEELAASGHPVLTMDVRDFVSLGEQFFLWEVGTAAAGALLGIDPFDQPDVQASKDNTAVLLDAYTATGVLPGVRARSAEAESGSPSMGVVGADDSRALVMRLRRSLSSVRAGDYVCLQVYAAPSIGIWTSLEGMRRLVRDRLHVATTAGYGPRFLHSTGQYHKGGPNNGVFLQLVAADARDARIPGQLYPFSVLKRAQADGDLASLQAKGRRVLRVEVGEDGAAGVAAVADALAAALGSLP